jgi:type I restriction enzyme S subunit
MVIKENYIETEIGKLPKDWKISEISKIATINGRVGWKGYTKKDLVNDGPFAIGAKHINKNNKLDLSDPTCLSIEKYLESPEIMVYKDDVLIVQRGTIGKIVLIENEIGEATINPSMLILRSKNVSSKYIYYYFVSEKGQNQIILDTSSTGVPMITQRQVLNFKIPIPTLAEQNIIATALSDADGLITGLEKLIAKKRNIKQGAMQQLLQPKEDWEVKKLGEIAEVRDGTHQTPKYVESGIPFYSVESVTNNNFTKTKFITKEEHALLTKTFKMEKGDILMTRIGSIGDCKLIDWDVDASFYVSLALLKIKKEFSANYICHYSKSSSFIKETELNSLQSAIPRKINLGPISNIKIELPSLDEQIRIATILSDMDAELSVLEQKLEKYKKVKLGMMQELLTGKTRLV